MVNGYLGGGKCGSQQVWRALPVHTTYLRELNGDIADGGYARRANVRIGVDIHTLRPHSRTKAGRQISYVAHGN
eukprot:358433-Chlamydomonas_euryale.AAC.2